MQPPLPDEDASRREQARIHVRIGEMDQAERLYRELLERHPDEAEALVFLGQRAVHSGRPREAIAPLERALQSQPANANVLVALGLAHEAAGDVASAMGCLERALAAAPEAFAARLHLGRLLERSGARPRALTTYFRAITDAQLQGRWLSDRSTPPNLRVVVKHAMRYVERGRRDLCDQALAPLLARHGREALRRVERCVAMHLGDVPGASPDPRQRPKFLFFPGIPSQAYLGLELMPWTRELEGAAAEIRGELQAVLAVEGRLEPFIKFPTQSSRERVLGGSGTRPAWDAFFFYRHGARHDHNHAQCPRTSAVLDASPLCRIREHAPEICFSVLAPGTHILPHHGVTNTRIVVHLPLIVPPGCALRVGGEEHVWREGRCVAFDDTYEHDAWNRSEQTRVVLIMDAWNPHLTEVERVAVTELVAAVGDFNREWKGDA